MAAKARTGCQLCRTKHLKCDQATPVCGRCSASGNECIRGFTYRFHREAFANDQKWLTTPNDLTFVDETKSLVNGSDYDSFSEYATPSPETRSNDLTATLSAPKDHQGMVSRSKQHRSILPISDSTGLAIVASVENSQPPSRTPSLASPFPQRLWEERPVSHISETLSHKALPSPPSSKPLTIDGILNRSASEPLHEEVHAAYEHGKVSPSTSRIYSDRPIWPLADPEEAHLLRHFIQNLAVWLDLCDPKQHFQVDVPQRAGSCRILLNAIFALSARHLNRIGCHHDTLASNRYHDECLNHLIPMLNDTATVSDESLFAATIVLRVLEEIDAPEVDSQGHRLGIQVFVGARDPLSGGLSEAAFWVGLRQEIYSAMMKHQSTQLNLEHCNIDRSLRPSSDYGWSNRAIVLCADVLNCCFGDSGVSTTHWEQLKEYSEQWSKSLPPSFTPIYYRAPDRVKREAFPEIWYSLGCHIIGVQHFLLANILLAIFDPKLPRIGGKRTAAVRSMESQVESSLRELCGIGMYNRWTAPGIFTASMGIAICGDRMTDRIDQEALLDVLKRTEKDHARPTAIVQQQMKESWRWISED